MGNWATARHTGEESVNLTVRVSKWEKEQLERMRVQYGLRSMAQVVRLALDELTAVRVGSYATFYGPDAQERADEQMDAWAADAEPESTIGLAEAKDGDARAAGGAGRAPDRAKKGTAGRESTGKAKGRAALVASS